MLSHGTRTTTAKYIVVAVATMSAAGVGRAAPPNTAPLRHYSCTVPTQSCPRLPQSWTEKSSDGTSGGTNAIESIDLSYFYKFLATVKVKGTPAGQPKECVMMFSEHLDASGGSDLGFFKTSNTVTVPTSPPDDPNLGSPPIEFHGNVSAHITDPTILKSWIGTNPAIIVSIVDQIPSKTKDGADCTWGYIETASADGSLTVNYRKNILYAPLGKPKPNPKFPPKLLPKPLAK